MARQLGELEKLIMDRIWSWDRPVTVRDVLEHLRGDRALAYTTVMTVMDNLYRKDFLTREKGGRAYLYRPSRSKEQYIAAFMGEALEEATDRTVTLLHFVENMSPAEAGRLRDALDTHAAGRQDSTTRDTRS